MMRVVPESVSAICLVSSTLKLSSSLSASCGARASARRIWSLTLSRRRRRPSARPGSADVLVAGDAALNGAQRHDHDVVLVHAPLPTGPWLAAGR